jgi:hypothetical protein
MNKNKRIFFPEIFCQAKQDKQDSIPNKKICTHLSNHILSNQSLSGNADPGSVSNIVRIINQPTASQTNREFFKADFLQV